MQSSFGYEGLWVISANVVYLLSCASFVVHMCCCGISFGIVVRDLSSAKVDSVYTFNLIDLALHHLFANGVLQVELTRSILQIIVFQI